MTVRKGKALDTLFAEFNKRFPKRSKISDGWLGDAAHRSRTSDHNAWINFGGDRIVSAIDVTEDAEGGFSEIIDWAFSVIIKNRDPRVKYLIHEGRICRSYDKPGIPAWTWARYTGPNAHLHHGHISVNSEARHFDSTKPWGLLVEKIYQPGERNLGFREGRDPLFGPDVRFVQRKIGMGTQDGYYGPKTAARVKSWEAQHNSQGKKPRLLADGIVGKGTWHAMDVTPKYGD